MAQPFRRKTRTVNGTKYTTTFSADGNVRQTVSTGNKYHRITNSTKSGKSGIRQTHSKTIGGWSTKTFKHIGGRKSTKSKGFDFSSLFDAPKKTKTKSTKTSDTSSYSYIPSTSEGNTTKFWIWVGLIVFVLIIFS